MILNYLKSKTFYSLQKTFRRFTALCIILLFAFHTTALSQTVSCDITLNDGGSISNALSAASEGETICLNPGEYAGGFTIDINGLSIVSSDLSDKAIIQGGSTGVRIQNSVEDVSLTGLVVQGYTSFGILGNSTERVTIDELEIIGNGNVTGILMNNSNNEWTITNSIIENNEYGIRLNRHNHVVSDNTFTNNLLDVNIRSVSSNLSFTNNVLSTGIFFDNSLTTTYGVSVFSHNIDSNTFSDGGILFYADNEDNPIIPENARQIIINNSTNVLISGYTFDGEVAPIQLFHTTSSEISDNQIINTTENPNSLISSGPVYIYRSSVLITENNFNNLHDRAIYILAGDNSVVDDNVLDTMREGIYVSRSEDVEIKNNSILNVNNTGFRTGHAVIARASENVLIQSNTITNVSGYGIYDDNPNIQQTEPATIDGNTISGVGNAGIQWRRTSNATIINNNITENNTGISASNSATISNNIVSDNSSIGIEVGSNNTLTGNQVKENTTGIFINSNNVSLSDNDIEDNTTGISINQRGNITLLENRFLNNQVDFFADNSTNLTITDNEFDTGIHINSRFTGFNPSADFVHYDHDISGNTIKGDPLLYIKNEANPSISPDAGQIIVFNSSDVVINGFELSNVVLGIQVLFSPKTNVLNSSISGVGDYNTGTGLIEIVESDSTIVSGSSLSNARKGVELRASEYVEVSDNIITHQDGINVFYGIHSKRSLGSELKDNTIITDGGFKGIQIENSEFTKIISNQIANTDNDGLVIENSDSVRVENNFITDGNAKGIYLSRSLNSQIIDNTILRNASHGIDTNTFSNLSHGAYLRGNTIEENGGTGVRLPVDDLAMVNNIMSGNDKGAELLAPVEANRNEFINNISTGIEVSGTDDTSGDFSQNTISGNGTGLVFSGSGVFNATQNWWGDASGPSGGATDPGTSAIANGSGDSVSSNVSFDPWLTSAPEDLFFDFYEFSVSDTDIFTGSTIMTSIIVENVSDATEEYEVDFKVDDSIINSKLGELDPGDADTLKFYFEAIEPGEFNFGINEAHSATVTVSPGWSQNLFSASNFSTAEFISGPETSNVAEKWSTSSSEFPNSVIGNPVILDGVIIYGRLNGRVYAREIESSDIIWERDLGGRFQTSPAVSGDQVLIVNNQGNLFSLNLSDGETQWTNNIGLSGSYTNNDVVTSSLTIAEGTIYLSLYNISGESFQARDISNGDLLWSHDIGTEAASTPAFSEGVIYVGSNDGKMYALSASDNVVDRLIWEYQTNSPFARLSPIVYDDKLVFASGSFTSENNQIHVVNRENGALIWSENLSGFSPSTPTVSNDVVFIGSQGATVYAFDVNNGNEVWTFEPEFESGTLTFTVTTPVVAGEILYIHSDGNQTPGRRFFGINTATGEPVFDLSTPRIGAGPVIFDDVAYVGYTNLGVRAYFDDTTPGETTFAYDLLSVSSNEMFTGAALIVTAQIENTGDNLGEYEASLLVDGVEVQVKSGELGVGNSETLMFYYQPTEPGNFEITIEDLDPEIVNVLPGWSQNNFGANNNSETQFLSGPNTEIIFEKWESPTQASVTGSPTIADGVIYYGMFDGSVYAADIETGEIIWERETGAVVRTSLAVNDSLVFGGNGDGDIFALNKTTGDVLWNHNRGHHFVASPTLVDDVVYISIFNDDDEHLQALDITTGNLLWSYDIGSSSASKPAFSNGVIYVGSNDQYLYALDASKEITDPNDRLLWSYDTGNSLGSSYPIVDENTVYINSGNTFTSQNNLLSIDASTGTLNWTNQLSGNYSTNPAISDSLIYIGTQDGVFYAFDKRNGDEIWNFEPNISFGTIIFANSDPVVADGLVYVNSRGNTSTNRRLFGLDKITGELIFEYDRTQNPNAGPVIFDGIAYVGYTNNGIRAYRSSVPEDFIADPGLSTVTATPQHFADGDDVSQVDLLVLNEFGNPIEGLTSDNFEIAGGAGLSIQGFEERFTAGTYRMFVSSTVVQNMNLIIEVDGVALTDQPAIQFLTLESNWEKIVLEDLDERSISVNALSLSFLNESIGYVLTGFAGDGFGDEASVLKTTDSGANWELVFDTTEDVYSDIFFINEDVGFLSGPALLKTTDGGQTWNEIDPDPGASFPFYGKMFFTDESKGWLSGNRTLYITEDLGENWLNVNLADSASGVQDIYFKDSDRGWIATSNSQLRDPGLIETSDGGLNWDLVIGEKRLTGIDFGGDNFGIAVGRISLQNEIYRTLDGGENWTLIEDDFDFQLTKVSLIDETRGWITGRSGTVFYTEDAGQTWTREYPGTSDNFDFTDIQMIDENYGWATGTNGTILKYDAISGVPIVDDQQSTITATSPHLADGEDFSTVTFTIVSTEGDSLNGLIEEDFVFNSVEPTVTIDGFSALENNGSYIFSVSASEAQSLSLTATVKGIALQDTVSIIFEEPIIIDADQSVVEATSPHVADGQDESLVSITVITTQGDTLSGLQNDEFSRSISGPGIIGNITESETPGIYTFTVASTEAQTMTVSVSVRDTILSDSPEIEFTEPEEPVNPISLIDADSSVVIASSPHIANGIDESSVSIQLKNSNGSSISGVQTAEILVTTSSELASVGEISELEGTGEYLVGVTSTIRGEVTITVTIDELQLSTQPTVIFTPDPTVNPDSSSVVATTPHFASGQDSSIVSIELKNENGEEISGFSEEDFTVTFSSAVDIAESVTETDTPGLYLLTVVSNSPGEYQVTVTADGVELADKPMILFEQPPVPIPDPPQFISITQDGFSIILNWSVDSEEFISEYTIYRGVSVNALSELETISSGVSSLTLTDVPVGTTYYAVTASNSEGEEGDQSNILSFVNDDLTATSQWSLSSIPLEGAVIESDLISAFSFSSGYSLADNLEPNLGYWVKTKTFDTEVVSASGGGLDSTSIVLKEGWNLIGSISDVISVVDITDVDGILTSAPVYTFGSDGYEESTQIIPGKGHWVFASDSGRIDLSVYLQGVEEEELETQSKTVENLAIPKITFSTTNHSSELYMSNTYLSEVELHQFMMPPNSPEPTLDIRTASDFKIVNNEPTELQIQSIEYPVTVELSGMDENSDFTYRLILENEKNQRSVDLIDNQPNVISEEYDYIRIEQIHIDELITEHKLMPNYPNPFNPTTTIHYQLREQTDVKIEVFDIIGRRVQVLANETQFSGEYRVNFDANSFASGVYIVRFVAGNYAEIRKMTLIK